MYPSNAIIKFTRNSAKQHRIDFPHKVVAVFYNKSTIVAMGFNQPYKTHPKAWTKYKTIHAEFDALMDLRRSLTWGKYDLSKYSLYVHRVRRDGKDGLSKPCECCQQMLAWAGITDIHWSKGKEDEGNID